MKSFWAELTVMHACIFCHVQYSVTFRLQLSCFVFLSRATWWQQRADNHSLPVLGHFSIGIVDTSCTEYVLITEYILSRTNVLFWIYWGTALMSTPWRMLTTTHVHVLMNKWHGKISWKEGDEQSRLVSERFYRLR